MIAEEAAAIAGEAVADKKCFLCSRRLIQMESASFFQEWLIHFIVGDQRAAGSRKINCRGNCRLPAMICCQWLLICER